MRYVAIAVIVVVLFLIWRITSVVRGARRRDARILAELAPLQDRLERKVALASDDVDSLARRPHLRGMLHQLLTAYGKADAFPGEFNTRLHHAETLLAYWMTHPNELQDPPETMERVDTISRRLGARDGEFLVFRYLMPPGHWAGGDWLLGLAGPFFEGDVPYADSAATAFAVATDKDGAVSPDAIVDRFIDIFEKKAGGWGGTATPESARSGQESR